MLDCVILGLKRAGWRLPPDRIEWQRNQYTVNTGELGGYEERPVSYVFKILGAKINVTGNCWQDVETKTQSIQGALAVRRKLWLVKSSTRKQRYYLMHRVAESQVLWACGGWEVTQRQLSKLRSTLFTTAKQFLRFPKIWTDSDQVYVQRVGRAIQEIKVELELPDVDVTILNRMCSYTGHLLRVINRDSSSLLAHAYHYWNQARRDDQALAHGGPQGHSGCCSPFNWEHQYVSYFKPLGIIKQSSCLDGVAVDRYL